MYITISLFCIPVTAETIKVTVDSREHLSLLNGSLEAYALLPIAIYSSNYPFYGFSWELCVIAAGDSFGHSVGRFRRALRNACFQDKTWPHLLAACGKQLDTKEPRASHAFYRDIIVSVQQWAAIL